MPRSGKYPTRCAAFGGNTRNNPMPLSKAKLKELRALATMKSREENARFMIEGIRMMQEAVDSDHTIVEAYYTSDVLDDGSGRALIEKLKKKSGHTEQVSSRDVAAIASTVTAQGVVAVIAQKRSTEESVLKKGHAPSIVVAVDSVADPGNLGSIVRTCDWFGVQGILLGQNSVDVYNPKVLRSTMGGIFHIPVVEDVDLLPALSKAKVFGYRVYATDSSGEAHFDRVRFAHKSVIVFGNEAWGVSDQIKQLADERIAIRRYGAAESLNVGVACGIVLSGVHRLYDE